MQVLDRNLGRRCGLSLIEVLVAMAIIGVLVGLLLPAVQYARESGRSVTCKNQLHQLSISLLNYEAARKSLPAGACNRNAEASNPVRLMDLRFPDTWFAEILPFMEQLELYDKFDFSEGTGSAVNRDLVARDVPGIRCPSDNTMTSICDWRCHWFASPVAHRMLGLWYAASSGNSPLWGQCSFCTPTYPTESNRQCCSGFDRGADGNPSGAFGLSQRRVALSRLQDGQSKTIMLGETLPRENMHNGAYSGHLPIIGTNIPINSFVPLENWPELNGPHINNYGEASGIKSMHRGGAHVGFCDGSVSFLNENTAFDVLLALGSRASGEVQ